MFELRTYTATKGNLGNLNDRFKDHTMKLFEKHGMTNVVYWNVLKGQKDDDKMLVYLLAHKSQDAAKKSFDDVPQGPGLDRGQGRQREEGRRPADRAQGRRGSRVPQADRLLAAEVTDEQ